ncbi:MAG: phosphoenolpyruvate synthase [Fluviicola sp. XM-24bin1]|nr:MAG: phosphoenolpyruvate synthase [Fluviicola sp. XM-24bin1]
MKTLITHNNRNLEGIGGKAKNLFNLDDQKIPVPKWSVIPESVVLNQLSNPDDLEQTKVDLVQAKVPKDVLSEIKEWFGEDAESKSYAVRSSAIDEDGAQFSFAGQFETFLHVSFDELEQHIALIWQSTITNRVITYRTENNLPFNFGIGVVVQEMLEPEVAGVAFGLNPVSGDTDEKVVSAVYGLGEGLVSGELNADTFHVKVDSIESSLVAKTHRMVRVSEGSGVVTEDVPENLQNEPSLNEPQLREIERILDQLNKYLEGPQDIEFAVVDSKVFLLQTRPVTAAGNKPEGEYILWDNSNIIESYPGITTPLTYSFIIKMYEMVYRQFVGLLGVKEHEIDQHKEVFANTLGLVRGRVYYNLLSWYKMLAMLPGYSINAEFMENMMGVKERFELKEDYRMGKGLARLRIIGMVFKMICLQRRLPKERDRFQAQLETIMSEYQALDYSSMSPQEIASHYARFEETLLLKWKAPLINDFFAMIWFGVLQKQTGKLCPEEPNIHNDLLCGSQDIISVEPIHRSMSISRNISANDDCKALFEKHTPAEIWKTLSKRQFPEIKEEIDTYIHLFGNRCVGELKLETISYGQDPTLFIKVIKSYVEQGITERQGTDNIEDQLRQNAEDRINAKLKGKPVKRWWFRYALKKARDLVSNRENLRYERTRGFGMVRTMFTHLGDRLVAEGTIEHPRDVFYLELDEILALQNGLLPENIKSTITDRKAEFASYREQRDPEERFFTYGNNFTDEYIYSTEKLEPIEGDLSGIGCCPGRVQAKVRVVKDPNEIESLNGDILVTSSTDPGWVTLFPTASAIIVERGSLLSHSAIVSREMGIPCIVSVTGLLRTLKTGDEVIMDGSTGEIKVVEG